MFSLQLLFIASFATSLLFLQCNVYRIQWPIHDVHIETVPWAPHNPHFTCALLYEVQSI